MNLNFKILALFEAVIIVILLTTLIFLWSEKTTSISDTNKLLSSRVYSNILEPQNYLTLNYDPLETELRFYLEQNNFTASIYIENLRDGANMGINEDDTFFPASMNKVPIAILVMKQIERNKLRLDTNLSILDNDKDSWWGMLYNTSVKELPVSILLKKMLQESDNTAFNVLRGNIPFEDDIAILEKYYGYYDKNNDDPNDYRNFANPVSFYNIYSSLYLSTVLEPENSEYILELLTNTSFNIQKIAGIPENVTIAHKFGLWDDENVSYVHDCGIIYDDKLRIFYCVMTKEIEPEVAIGVIGTIVHKVYRYSKETRTELDNYKGREGN